MTSLITSIAELREKLAACRMLGPVGLVPTMGALHAGHARLIEQARTECRTVVVSIFVNPLQFDRHDDLTRYPRTLQTDVEVCASLEADAIFAPTEQEMYPDALNCTVHVGRIGDHLCGLRRPGHFNGVATVVLKLLHIVQPDRAYFGEKDAQQLAVIRKLVKDLNVAVEIVEVPTVRDADGLAMSSRNHHLKGPERQTALALPRALRKAAEQIAAGFTDVPLVKREAAAMVPEGATLEYLEIVDPVEMQPLERINGPVRVAGALWVGSTRLIDNLLCRPPEKGPQTTR